MTWAGALGTASAPGSPVARWVPLSRQPHGDGAEDEGSSVDGGELVVAGGDAAPLLVVVERALDDVAALVGDRVEGRWSATGRPAAGAMPDLVGRMRITAVMPPSRSMVRVPREE